MTKTPRTDAEIAFVIRKTAEELERGPAAVADTYEKIEALLCEMQGLRDELVETKKERDEVRKALQSVMDWNPKPEPTDRPQTVARFEADMARAREVEKQRNAAIDALKMIAYDCNNPRADYQAVADAALMDIENMRGELK